MSTFNLKLLVEKFKKIEFTPLKIALYNTLYNNNKIILKYFKIIHSSYNANKFH